MLPNGLVIKTILLLVTTILGFITSQNISREMQLTDPGFIVIDEVAGLWLTLFIFEIFFSPVLIWSCIGFILFRLFDIIKPYPISLAEKLNGGTGIMMDDLLAGIFSAAILILIKIL